MCLLGRSVAFLLSAILLASCTPTPEGKQGGNEIADLPRLVDLGSNQCTPCKQMAPILDKLKQDYSGVVDVEVIDIRRDAAASIVHRVRIIPTQVFLNRAGREIFRHEGFFSREEIEAIFRDSLGVAVVPETEVDDAAVPAREDSIRTKE